MTLRRIAVSAALVAVLAAWPPVAGGFRQPEKPPPGLNARGRVLWNLEGLLRQTFGGKLVCVPYARPWEFRAGDAACTPLSQFAPYFYVFAPHTETSFHLAAKHHRPLSFGNYPVALRVYGRMIACDAHETRFVIEYRDSINFTVDCLRGG
jgi:hypothetical protein